MKTFLLVSACAICAASAASAHITMKELYVPAGYKYDMEMRVPHGCKASPVKEVHVRIPDNVTGVSVAENRDWKIEVKNRKLPQPMPGEGGVTLTETVDEIVWKDPKSPLPASGYFEGFHFRVSLPKEEGAVLWFKAYSVCLEGDDKYVEVPKEPMSANMPDFGKKIGTFMRSVPGPAPFVILIKPARPQYPWESAEPAKATAK